MIEWNKVTWYSKITGMFVFLGIVPVIAFFIGIQYGFTVIEISSSQKTLTLEEVSGLDLRAAPKNIASSTRGR